MPGPGLGKRTIMTVSARLSAREGARDRRDRRTRRPGGSTPGGPGRRRTRVLAPAAIGADLTGYGRDGVRRPARPRVARPRVRRRDEHVPGVVADAGSGRTGDQRDR